MALHSQNTSVHLQCLHNLSDGYGELGRLKKEKEFMQGQQLPPGTEMDCVFMDVHTSQAGADRVESGFLHLSLA